MSKPSEVILPSTTQSNLSRVYNLIIIISLCISCLALVDFTFETKSFEETVTNKKSYRQKRLRSSGSAVQGIITNKREYVLFKGSSKLFSINDKITVNKSRILQVPRTIIIGKYKVRIGSIYNGYGIFIWAMLIANIFMVYYHFKPKDINFSIALMLFTIILACLVVGYFGNQRI